MRTRRIPGTDLDLSVVGFGGWAIGGEHWGDDVDDDRSIRAVHRALDLGITWFDTAPIYGWGHSEEVLVRALGDRRREVVIATKVGVRRVDGHATSTLTPAFLREDLEATLRRLRADTVDLLQVHWPCELGTPLEESFGALDALRREGKLRHLGVCNHDGAALRRIAAITPIVSIQSPYSLLRREAEADVLPTARALGLGFLAYEPLTRGLLTGKFAFPPAFPPTDMRARDDRFAGAAFHHGRRLADDLGKVGAKLGVSAAAVAIGWVAAQPGVTAVIAGAKGPEQVEQNARAAALLGRAHLWDVVGRIAAVHGGTPRSTVGR